MCAKREQRPKALTIKATKPRDAVTSTVAFNQIVSVAQNRRLPGLGQKNARKGRLGARRNDTKVRQHEACVAASIDGCKHVFGLYAQTTTDDQVTQTVSIEIVGLFAAIAKDAIGAYGPTGQRRQLARHRRFRMS